MTSQRRDLIGGAVMLALGGAFTLAALSLPHGTLQRPGPGFMPLYASAALTVLALGLLIRACLVRSAIAAAPLFDRSVVGVAIVLAAMLAYTLFLPFLGFAVSTCLLLAVLFRAGGFRTWRSSFGIAVIAAVLSDVLFVRLLHVRFPQTWLGL